jgi:hypothetical protein
LTGGIIPHEEDIKFWYDILIEDPFKKVYKIEEDTWGFKYLFKEKDLFILIEKYQTIYNFAEDFQKTTGEILKWLNELYELLNVKNYTNCLNKYKLIPNQKGVFLKSSEIFGNDNEIDEKIPSIINPIYKEISKEKKELYDIIINKDIDLNNLDKSINKKNFNDILNEFSNFFKDEKNDFDKKVFLCNKFISFDINDKIIQQMFEFRKDIQPTNEYKRKEKLEYYNEGHKIWNDIKEYWFDYHSQIIENFKNIENLSRKLYNNEFKKEETYIWLNKYITFFKDNSTIIEKKEIFPDKNGNFKKITDLRSAIDIPEILIDFEN